MFAKVCGIRRLEDGLHAAAQGATALGFVFWPGSPRAIAVEEAARIIAALPAGVATVGVFVNESAHEIARIVAATGLSAVQLHGEEPPTFGAAVPVPVYRSLTLLNADATTRAWPEGTTFVLDAADPARRGGTGQVIDWDQAALVARRDRVVLAGGLTPLTVAEAIERVRPFGVDVSSGVESAPGIKDADKVSLFLANARRAFGAG